MVSKTIFAIISAFVLGSCSSSLLSAYGMDIPRGVAIAAVLAGSVIFLKGKK